MRIVALLFFIYGYCRRFESESEKDLKFDLQSRLILPIEANLFSRSSAIYRDVNVSYYLGFPIFSMLVLTHLFFKI